MSPTTPGSPTRATGPSPRAATAGTWVLPLLLLAPLAVIGLLVESPSTPWRVVSWVLWGLSAISTFAGWTTVARHGMRAPAAWVMCVAVHAVLAWRLLVLVTE